LGESVSFVRLSVDKLAIRAIKKAEDKSSTVWWTNDPNRMVKGDQAANGFSIRRLIVRAKAFSGRMPGATTA